MAAQTHERNGLAQYQALDAVIHMAEHMPVTADGVRVVPGMELWAVSMRGNVFKAHVERDPSLVSICYSTQASAALAAKGGE